jgi:ribosomal protein S18 acetylase RimI-like enzyme
VPKSQIKLRCRPFTDQDLGLLRPWLADAGLGVPDAISRTELLKRLCGDDRIICRAALSGRGLVVGFYRMDLAPDATAEVTLIVAPSKRRRGYGRMLLEAAIAEARTLRLRGLVAVIAESNRAAIRLFLDAGFDQASRRLPGFMLLERMVHQADHVSPIEIVP